MVLSAGTATERVPDESAFRRHLVEVLAGRAPADEDADGKVSSDELFGYVSKLVASEVPQTPMFATFPERRRIMLEISSDAVAPTSERPSYSPDEMNLVIEINNWNNMLGRDDVAAYHGFCRQYPEGKGHFRSLARANLKRRGKPIGDCAP